MVALYFPRGADTGCCEPEWIYVAIVGIVGLVAGVLVARAGSD